MEYSSVNPFSLTPAEVNLAIFEFLPISTLCQMKCVCKNFHELVTELILAKRALQTGHF